ncbi:MAG: aromatic aminobenezylarsenical efflux permease ArsG family transporter [Armatimonadota bacterium]
MSETGAIPVVTALWLGLLSSVSPCPLATNLVALSFIAQQVARPSAVMISGFLYTLGRALAYTIVAVIVVTGLLNAPGLSYFLQNHFHRLLGPLLIVVGAVLLDIVSLPVPSNRLGLCCMERVSPGGFSALLLGFVFALTFCPVSAALFFGALIPLCLQSVVYHFYPLLFGVGTAIPVVVFAVLLGRGVEAVGSWLGKLSQVEKVFRGITGVLFVGIGVYLTGSAILRWW